MKVEPNVGMVDWRKRQPPDSVRGISSDLLFRGENLLIALVRVDPGASVPVHVHEHSDEIFDVLEGNGEIFRNGEWEAIVPGMTVLVEAGARHAIRNPAGTVLVMRETVRDRVYARAAFRAAVRKRWPGLLG